MSDKYEVRESIHNGKVYVSKVGAAKSSALCQDEEFARRVVAALNMTAAAATEQIEEAAADISLATPIYIDLLASHKRLKAALEGIVNADIRVIAEKVSFADKLKRLLVDGHLALKRSVI